MRNIDRDKVVTPELCQRLLRHEAEDVRVTTGKQFDPTVVTAFCRALLKEVNGETKDRRIMKMLGKNYLDPEQAVPLLKELISELEVHTRSAVVGSA